MPHISLQGNCLATLPAKGVHKAQASTRLSVIGTNKHHASAQLHSRELDWTATSRSIQQAPVIWIGVESPAWQHSELFNQGLLRPSRFGFADVPPPDMQPNIGNQTVHQDADISPGLISIKAMHCPGQPVSAGPVA